VHNSVDNFFYVDDGIFLVFIYKRDYCNDNGGCFQATNDDIRMNDTL